MMFEQKPDASQLPSTISTEHVVHRKIRGVIRDRGMWDESETIKLPVFSAQ